MDLISLHIMSGLLSAALMLIATVVAFYCVFSFFSYKPGGSLRFAFSSLLYFFSAGILLLIGSSVLRNIPTGSVYLVLGIDALIMSALAHIGYGFLVVALYARTVIWQ
jgi:hypothetical protein